MVVVISISIVICSLFSLERQSLLGSSLLPAFEKLIELSIDDNESLLSFEEARQPFEYLLAPAFAISKCAQQSLRPFSQTVQNADAPECVLHVSSLVILSRLNCEQQNWMRSFDTNITLLNYLQEVRFRILNCAVVLRDKFLRVILSQASHFLAQNSAIRPFQQHQSRFSSPKFGLDVQLGFKQIFDRFAIACSNLAFVAANTFRVADELVNLLIRLALVIRRI